ncbi:MAG: hypothetical protein BWY45_02863 [Euryarchaeota archaeon ADurb.Bin294]|nr:MAG: hypothetical protein BWY45_02863 [Euryarchaeota archaeon ADurb.Bin294]
MPDARTARMSGGAGMSRITIDPIPPVMYPERGYSQVFRANASNGAVFPSGSMVVNWSRARMA